MQRRNRRSLRDAPLHSSRENAQAHGRGFGLTLKAISYRMNAGTIEYLVDEAGEEFLLYGINTRIQVEHPVTEEVMGCELIKEQIG